jgi:hypothetical protein
MKNILILIHGALRSEPGFVKDGEVRRHPYGLDGSAVL